MKACADFSTRPLAAVIALIGFAYFVIAVAALYILNPSYDLISSLLGNYGLAPFELPVASTFFGLGLGSLALMIGLHQRMSRLPAAWMGLTLLAIWGLGLIIAGIFPANEGGGTLPHRTTVLIAGIFPVEAQAYPETIYSFIHILALIGSFVSLSLATIFLSWRFKFELGWHSIQRLSSFLALVLMLACLLLCQAMFLSIHTDLVRFSLELLTISSLAWLFLTATRLWSEGA
jgi:hypothetical protein